MTTNARRNVEPTSIRVTMARSEAFGPQQRVGQVEQQAQRHQPGKRIVEDHGSAPLQAFAGIGVADACQEEACAERQHDNVQHGMFLCDVNRGPDARPRFERLKCHRAHRFSRWKLRQRYRNLISARRPGALVPATYSGVVPAKAHRR